MLLGNYEAVDISTDKANFRPSAIGMQSLSNVEIWTQLYWPGRNMQGFLDGVGDGNIYKSVTPKRMPNDWNAFIRDKQRIINTIIQFLNSRFESVDSNPVFAAGKIFDAKV